MVEKFYNEKGEVGVIYSPGYGAGFSTWHEDSNICFDKNIIQMILNKNEEGVKEYCKDNGIYYGGGQLEIKWVKPNSVFTVTEYDGYETVKVINYPTDFLVA